MTTEINGVEPTPEISQQVAWMMAWADVYRLAGPPQTVPDEPDEDEEPMVECLSCGCEMSVEHGEYWLGNPTPYSWRSDSRDGAYCYDCLEECEDCGHMILDSYITVVDHDCDNRRVCERCADEYGSCADCGAGFHSDHLYYQDDGRWRDSVLCAMCEVDARRTSHLIRCYTWQPDRRHFWFVTDKERGSHRALSFAGVASIADIDGWRGYFGTSEYARVYSRDFPEIAEHYNDLFLGYELETNNRSCSNLHEAAEFLLESPTHDAFDLDGQPLTLGDDYLYLKEDGSISGFEIVTHPATLEAHKRLLPREAFRSLANMGLSSWHSVNGTGAGLHVHVSKASFSHSHLHKFQLFHYENAEFLKKFAGRDSGRWANFALQGNNYKMSDFAKGDYSLSLSDRYHALNFVPRNTVELRYFRGSLKPETVLAVLEMVHAIWTYTRMTTSADYRRHGFGWSNFTEWVVTRADYEFLPKVMSDRQVAV